MHKKRRKRVAFVTLSRLHDEDSWLFSSLCNAISNAFELCEKESYGEPPQKVREGDKIQSFLLSFVSLLSRLLGFVMLF